MKNKSKKIITLIILIILCVLGLYKFSQKVAYIEYQKYGETCEEPLDMSDNTFSIEQDFQIPYNMFYGISLRIATYGRENNSTYTAVIRDKTTNKKITAFEFNSSQAKDDEYYELFLKSPVQVDSTHDFSVTIQAKTLVNAENGIAFYADKEKANDNNGTLTYNQTEYDGNLCMNVYGGNTNRFWIIFTLICEAYLVALVMYITNLKLSNKPIKNNGIVQAGILGIVVFALMVILVNMGSFSDEVDNIAGGMLIQKGEVLYTDYRSAHTPFAYWLCAVFAIIGAESVEQFRLLYYFLTSLVFVGLFLRHKDNFGTKKMFVLPILQILFGVMFTEYALMLLSDNIQAVCMIALLLEFLQYLKDEKIDWKRSIIVSLSIFCSFGSAFVSVYAIFAICLGVFIKEIIYLEKNSTITFKNLINRYYKLVIACVIPFIGLFVYLIATHSFKEFYRQAYKFNTEVYSIYLGNGYGTNVIQPFFIGINNFLQVIPNTINTISQQTDIVLICTQTVLISIVASVIFVIVKSLYKKEYLTAIILFMFVCFNYTRTNEDFHTISAWTTMLTIILTYWNMKNVKGNTRKFITTFAIILVIFMISRYTDYANENFFKEKETVGELAQEIIQETDENEKIFLNIFSDPQTSVYLIYKNRLPINKLTFILPWYMDWYEMETVQELQTDRPNIAIYDEGAKVWEITGYDQYLLKYLHENYEPLSENKKIWVLREKNS